MKVYYDGSDINAKKIKRTLLESALDFAEFEITNRQNENYDTWKNRQDEQIVIYSHDLTEMRFIGNITNVIPQKDKIKIMVFGSLMKLKWNPIDTILGEMVLLEGLSYDSPGGTSLTVKSPKDELPTLKNGTAVLADHFNDDSFSPKWVIISDDTLEDSKLELNPTASSTTDTETGTNANVAEADEVYYIGSEEIDSDGESVTNTHEFDLGSSIARTNVLQTIRIQGVVQIYLDKQNLGSNYYAVQIWWEDHLKYGEHIIEKAYIWTHTNTDSKTINLPFDTGNIEIPPGDSNRWFNDDGSYWDRGNLKVICTRVTSAVIWKTTTIYVKTDYAKITLTYSTDTFEEINQKISDTIPGSNTIVLKCFDGATPNAFIFSTKGIAIDDDIRVTVGLEEALNRVFTGSGLTKDFTITDKGVAQTYAAGLDKYDLFLQLISSDNLLFWTEYDLNPIIHLIKESDIDAATYTYDSNNDPPSIDPVVELPNNEFGFIVVKYKFGTTRPIAAIVPSTNKKTKVVDAPHILTRTEAISLAMEKAEYYSSIHRSIHLTWNYEPSEMPQVGTKYNVQLYKWNGTDTRITFTLSDQICRRVTEEYQDGRTTVQAFFGGGHTPHEEKMGREIGLMKRRERIKNAMSDADSVKTVIQNYTGTSITHNNLSGVYGSSLYYHLSTLDYAALTDVNAQLTALHTDGAPTFDGIHFDLTPTAENGEGFLVWGVDEGTLVLKMAGGSVEVPYGKKLLVRVKNESGATIPKGKVVYFTGATGARPKIDLAKADSFITGAYAFGITDEIILNNSLGYVNSFGVIKNFDTSDFTEGYPLWISETTAGDFTQTRPTSPNIQHSMGVCLRSHATEGKIFMHRNLSPRLAHLSDVHVTSLSDNDILQYNLANLRFENTDTPTFATPTEDGHAANKLYVDNKISDSAYSQEDWDNVTSIAPSKNALFDKIDTVDNNISALAGANDFKGLWDASSGSYPVAPLDGDFWRVSVEGTTENLFFEVWDLIVWNGTIWQRVKNQKAEVFISVSTQDSIQEAVDLLNTAGGGTLFLEQGTHDTSTDTFPIVIDMAGDKLTIYGVGDLSIIDKVGNTTATTIRVTNAAEVTLRDFKIVDDNCTSNTANLIDINDSNNNPVLVERVTLVGGNNFGTAFRVNSSNVEIARCDISDCGQGIAAYLSTDEDINIHNNYFHSNAGYVIYILSISPNTSAIINENILDNSSATHSIYISCDYSTITDNVIRNSGIGILLQTAVHCIVSNNLIDGVDNTGAIQLIQLAHYNIITGNSINDCALSDAGSVMGGIYIASDYNIISNNKISNCVNAGAGDYSGIYLSALADNNKISNNLFFNCDVNITDIGTSNEGIKYFGIPAWHGLGTTVGYISSVGARNTQYYMPNGDNDCVAGWIIDMPNISGDETFTLKCEYILSSTSGSFSGKWSVASLQEGDVTTSNNVLNDSTAYDLTVTTVNLLTVKSIPLSNTNISNGDALTVQFKSDTANTPYAGIRRIWVEVT